MLTCSLIQMIACSILSAIACSLLASFGQYPTVTAEHDVWMTIRPKLINPGDLSTTLPFQWKIFFDISCQFTTMTEKRHLPASCSPQPSCVEGGVQIVDLVESIVGTVELPTNRTILAPLKTTSQDSIESERDEQLRRLDNLCRQNCIKTRVHTVFCVLTNNATIRLRNPAQEYLSVIQSERD
ncbi:hypothetical protein BLNAU_17625 [Blattamonas nauphoetae]|uniref:Secreted protein n=1 Tax=Blattamonas nauphoetae TaxID=2049346 RepID=A0ABQ9X6N4_9EUKA|nr:hypothetical protein BLNAU_17625 [Blattamonas nauphoetae]